MATLIIIFCLIAIGEIVIAVWFKKATQPKNPLILTRRKHDEC